MLKYIDLTVDNYAIPQETVLVITLEDEQNLSGIPLFIRELQRILERYKDITGVVFHGAEFKPALITYWVNYVYKHFKDLKIGWFGETNTLPKCLPLQKMDYIKLKDELYQRDYQSSYTKFEKAWIRIE